MRRRKSATFPEAPSHAQRSTFTFLAPRLRCPPARRRNVGRTCAASDARRRQRGAGPGAGRFAPGVLTTIPPSVDREDVISTHDVPEILADKSLEWTPSSTTKSRTLFEMAKDAVFINDVWCLEFAFKPLRMIEVDVPQPSGRVQRKNIWYMVYRVRNTGAGLTGKANDDGTFETAAKSTDEIRFVPELVLASNDRSAGQRVRKAYLDRIVPAALGPIQQRELPRGELFNSAELATQLLKIEGGRTQQGVWGVAMWEDVDPQIDFFSIYVRGLSNGLAWTDPPGALKLGDPPGTGASSPTRRSSSIFGGRGTISARPSGRSASGQPPSGPTSTIRAKALLTAGFTGRIAGLDTYLEVAGIRLQATVRGQLRFPAA